MRHTILSLVLLIVMVAPTLADVMSHPTDPAATFLGSYSVEAVIGNVHSYNVIVVWSLSSGGIDYVFDVESVSFSGGCAAVNALALEDIAEAAADAAIVEGVYRGYPACTSTAFTTNVRIWSVSCAQRTGSGCTTAFETCSTEAWCYRLYEVSCAGNGVPTITQKPGSSCSCSGTCEGSCTDSNFD